MLDKSCLIMFQTSPPNGAVARDLYKGLLCSSKCGVIQVVHFSDGGSPFEGPNVSGMLRSFFGDYVKGLAVLLCQINAFNDGEIFLF